MNFIRQGKVFFEKSLDIGDYSYNFILGQYSEGGFICFPSWERSSKISIDPNGYEDNLDQLLRSGFDITVSERSLGILRSGERKTLTSWNKYRSLQETKSSTTKRKDVEYFLKKK